MNSEELNIDEIVNKLIVELKQLPNGTEISMNQLLCEVENKLYNDKEYCEIFDLFYKMCNEQNIILDFSKHDNEKIGLIQNIPFVKKTNEENNVNYEFYKKNEDDIVWWANNPDVIGEHLFSFDKITIFNLFRDYPYKLTDQQKEIFDKENPYWADFFKDRN